MSRRARERHWAFWAVDAIVVSITWYFWGMWDALFTVGVFTLAIIEGEVIHRDKGNNVQRS